MTQRFYNNARGVLAGPVIEIDDTVVLQDHVGLPTSLPAGDWFSLTVLNETSRYGSNLEIMKVTSVAVSGANLELVVARGQDGTAAVAHDLGEKAEARITRMSIEALLADAKGYTDVEITALLDAAPGALDTLNELAAALGDDPNFATTMTTALADKVAKSHLTDSDPHTQYELKAALKAAAYRGVVGPVDSGLMAAGFLGVGGVSVGFEGDFNNSLDTVVPKNGTWYVGGSPDTTKAPAANGIVTQYVAELSGSYRIHQVFYRVNDQSLEERYRTHQRYYLNGVWTPWHLLYNSANIVGTVSQSGGVPTGAIMEEDSNSFGYWSKHADGTMECWGYVEAAYANDNTLTAVWNYPQSFVNRTTPACQFIDYRDPAAITGSNRFSSFDGGWTVVRASALSSITVYVGKNSAAGNYVSGDKGTLLMRAKGHWYGG